MYSPLSLISLDDEWWRLAPPPQFLALVKHLEIPLIQKLHQTRCTWVRYGENQVILTGMMCSYLHATHLLRRIVGSPGSSGRRINKAGSELRSSGSQSSCQGL